MSTAMHGEARPREGRTASDRGLPGPRLGAWAIAALLLASASAARAEDPAAPSTPAPAGATTAAPMPATVPTEALEPATADAAPPAAPAAEPAEMAAEPAAAGAPAGAEDAPGAMTPEDAVPPLGAVGYDEQGRAGRIHVVVRGDTLWDISEAYLGTPWVWPPIWKDNDDIANPHRIFPGDRIWITPWEMRRLSAEEAARMLAARPAAPAPEPEVAGDTPPAAPAGGPQQVFHRETVESIGLISQADLDAAASIVKAQASRVLLATGDRVYIGMGRDEVAKGDRFTIFRTREKVFDPETGRMLGWHIDMLGWLEVTEPSDESSLAEVRLSRSEIEVGDRLMPRDPPPADIPVGPSPEGVEGRISFFPNGRTLMGSQDFVYLNRGSDDGLVVGSPLEVFREGTKVPETARDEKVRVPDRVVAQLLVVRAQPNSCVALVRHSEEELALGDRFRGASR
jgi:hypothetical protein